jgi:hypothetical protein
MKKTIIKRSSLLISLLLALFLSVQFFGGNAVWGLSHVDELPQFNLPYGAGTGRTGSYVVLAWQDT